MQQSAKGHRQIFVGPLNAHWLPAAPRSAVRGLTNFIMHEAQLHAKKGESFVPEEDLEKK